MSKITLKYKNRRGELVHEATPFDDVEEAMKRARWLTVNNMVAFGTMELDVFKENDQDA